MIKGTSDFRTQDDIAASWDRCERQHKLIRDSARPIMRLQSSEVAPRLEQIVERTGGRQGFFRQIANAVGDGKRCLVVTDAEGVLVRLEADGGRDPDADWNGIALGTCWNEQIAGTNGVAMALLTQRSITVSGSQHFYSKLQSFACTGAPILDAEGVIVGSVNVVTRDQGMHADHILARQFLQTATQRIQRRLFEQHFAQEMLISVSATGYHNPLAGDGLIAVDEAGVIQGATAGVTPLLSNQDARGLKGQAFEAVFNLESQALSKVPDRVLSMPMSQGMMVNFVARLPRRSLTTRPVASIPARPKRQRRLPPSLRQLATGSKAMAAACAQAETVFRSGTPLLLEGETGTGKSALIAALIGDAPVFKVDCATMGNSDEGARNLSAMLGQARLLAMAPETTPSSVTVIFDNIEEMPASAQAELRRILDEIEADRQIETGLDGEDLRIVLIAKEPLENEVSADRFRNDLFYMIAATKVCLPPLRARENPEILAQVLATQIAGQSVEISDQADQLIKAHTFPGNVRELRGALKQALMASKSGHITPVDLRATSIVPDHSIAALSRPTTTRMIDYDERTLINDALTSSGWNVAEAARRLGIGRATINRKIKRHGLTRPL